MRTQTVGRERLTRMPRMPPWGNRRARRCLDAVIAAAAMVLVQEVTAATMSAAMPVSLVISAHPCTVRTPSNAAGTVGVSCPSSDAWRLDTSSDHTDATPAVTTTTRDATRDTLVTVTW